MGMVRSPVPCDDQSYVGLWVRLDTFTLALTVGWCPVESVFSTSTVTRLPRLSQLQSWECLS